MLFNFIHLSKELYRYILFKTRGTKKNASPNRRRIAKSNYMQKMGGYSAPSSRCQIDSAAQDAEIPQNCL